MDGRQFLPRDLDGIPPGSALAAVLESVDPARLPSVDKARHAEAVARQLAHYHAVEAESVVQLGLNPYADLGVVPPPPKEDRANSKMHVAHTLKLSTGDAEYLYGVSKRLVNDMPQIHALLKAGRISVQRARTAVLCLAGAKQEAIDKILGKYLARLEGMTEEQIRKTFNTHRMREDPESRRRRYQADVADRGIWNRLNENGTASLGGYNLPADRAAAAHDFLDRLARTARSDGDIRTMKQLKADFFLDLLAGLPPLLHARTDPITDEADRLYGNPPAPTTGTTDPGTTGDPGADGGGGDGDGDGGDNNMFWQAGFAAGVASMTGVTEGTVVTPANAKGTVNVLMKLTTLIGLNDHPALIPGWGSITADIARQVAYDLDNKPNWLYSVTDDYGKLLTTGHMQRKPSAAERAFTRARDGTCRGPYCTRDAKYCEDDHRLEREHGGPSHRGNLDTLCTTCHRWRHTVGMKAQRIGGDRAVVWTGPDGRMYFVPEDGNLTLLGDHLYDGKTETDEHGNTWGPFLDLDDVAPYRPITVIYPTTGKPQP